MSRHLSGWGAPPPPSPDFALCTRSGRLVKNCPRHEVPGSAEPHFHNPYLVRIQKQCRECGASHWTTRRLIAGEL